MKIIKEILVWYSIISYGIISLFSLYNILTFNIDTIYIVLLMIWFLPTLVFTIRHSVLIYNHFFGFKEKQYRYSREQIQEMMKGETITLVENIRGFSFFLMFFTGSLFILFYSFTHILTGNYDLFFIPGAVFSALWYLRDIFIIGIKTL